MKKILGIARRRRSFSALVAGDRLLPLGNKSRKAETVCADGVAEGRRRSSRRPSRPDRSCRARRSQIKPRVSGIVEEIYVEAGAEGEGRATCIAKIRLDPGHGLAQRGAEPRWTRRRSPSTTPRSDSRAERGARSPTARSRPPTSRRSETALENTRTELRRPRSDNLDLIQKGISRTTGDASNTLVRSTIVGDGPRGAGEGRQLGDRDEHLQRRDDDRHDRRHGRHDLPRQGRRVRGRQAQARHDAPPDDRRGARKRSPRRRSSTSRRRGSRRTARSSSRSRPRSKPIKDVVIRANYSANADIVLDRRDDVLALNESLLAFEDGKKFVEVETAPQKFEKREVKTGLSDGIQVEIVSGLADRPGGRRGPIRPGGRGRRGCRGARSRAAGRSPATSSRAAS